MSFNEIRWIYWWEWKVWEIWTKSVRFRLFSTKMWFSQNHTSTDFFFKNEARKLKFGLVVPLYIVSTNPWNIFLNFLFFGGNIAGYVQNFGFFLILSKVLDIFQKKKNSKIWSMDFQIPYRGTPGPNFSFLL